MRSQLTPRTESCRPDPVLKVGRELEEVCRRQDVLTTSFQIGEGNRLGKDRCAFDIQQRRCTTDPRTNARCLCHQVTEPTVTEERQGSGNGGVTGKTDPVR